MAGWKITGCHTASAAAESLQRNCTDARAVRSATLRLASFGNSVCCRNCCIPGVGVTNPTKVRCPCVSRLLIRSYTAAAPRPARGTQRTLPNQRGTNLSTEVLSKVMKTKSFRSTIVRRNPCARRRSCAPVLGHFWGSKWGPIWRPLLVPFRVALQSIENEKAVPISGTKNGTQNRGPFLVTKSVPVFDVN
jgi:hypothetical protein